MFFVIGMVQFILSPIHQGTMFKDTNREKVGGVFWTWFHTPHAAELAAPRGATAVQPDSYPFDGGDVEFTHLMLYSLQRSITQWT